ncbi:MAG: VanW family protein [Clostridia bacterium]|nr:VanW family protein [Clostridia bacterium]
MASKNKKAQTSKKSTGKANAKTNNKSTAKATPKKEVKQASSGSKKLLITLVSLVAVLSLVYCGLLFVTQKQEEKRQEIINSGIFHEGIKVNGVAIGGMKVDEAKDALKNVTNAMEKDIMLTITSTNGNIVASGADLGIVANIDEVLNEAMLLGRTGKLRQMEAEIEDVKINGRTFTLALTLDEETVNTYLDNLSKELGATPTNASFAVKELPMSETKGINAYDTVNIGLPEDGSITDLRDLRFDFIEEKDGIEINRDEFISKLKERIANNDFSYFELPAKVTPASVTVADIKAKLVLRVAVSTSYASGNYGRSTRVHNMTKATGLVYGTVLQPGEQFSANTILGYRTLASGWQLAPAVIDGGAANEDQPGGGVCQISSTIYQAVLKADYQVDYRQGHSSKLGYVKGGLDATIDSGRIDFLWTNNTSSPVYVFTWIDKKNKEVWCELYGEPFGDSFDEINLISDEQDPIAPTETEYIQKSSLTAPYWQVKNAAKKGYVFKTYKSYLKDGKEVDRKFITTTTYRMHPARYYVWAGYAGEPLLPEFEIKAEE